VGIGDGVGHTCELIFVILIYVFISSS
jgi:hypothetical protein